MSDKYSTPGVDQVVTNPLLTGLSGAATTFSTSAFVASFRSILKSVGAVAGGASATTDIVTGKAFNALIGGGSVANAPGQGCVFLWLIKNDGSTMAVAQSNLVALDAQDNFTWQPPNFPAVPDSFIPFAYSVIKAKNAASAAGWLFGTNNWNVSGIGISVANLATLPDRLVVA